MSIIEEDRKFAFHAQNDGNWTQSSYSSRTPAGSLRC